MIGDFTLEILRASILSCFGRNSRRKFFPAELHRKTIQNGCFRSIFPGKRGVTRSKTPKKRTKHGSRGVLCQICTTKIVSQYFGIVPWTLMYLCALWGESRPRGHTKLTSTLLLLHFASPTVSILSHLAFSTRAMCAPESKNSNISADEGLYAKWADFEENSAARESQQPRNTTTSRCPKTLVCLRPELRPLEQGLTSWWRDCAHGHLTVNRS